MSVTVLEAALYSRLTGDGPLAALTGQGTWNPWRPEELAFDLARPLTWVTFRLQSGGDTHEAQGERFKDVTCLVMGHADGSLSMDTAMQIDSRIEALLDGWTATLAGWPNVWPAERGKTVQVTEYEDGRVVLYSAGAEYRFRYGQAT